VLMNINYYLVF